MLAASTSECVKGHSLSSALCFDFLLSLPQRALIVGYGLNYDVNMWIKDVDEDHLRELWTTGHTQWRQYSLSWHPGKMFSIGTCRRRIPYLKHDGSVGKRVVYEQHVTIWDVLGFFQSKFVEALEFWKVGTNEQWETIARMKDKRSAFTETEKLEIEAYCFTECELLVVMVRKLLDYTEKLGLKLTRYDGAGAIAAAMMRKHNVKEYIAEPPEECESAVMRAYIGGRFETSIIGTLKTAYAYDVNSAYPTQTVQLPCLRCGKWTRTVQVHPHTLLHVVWDLGNALPVWGPFPFRNPDGSIVYPMVGEGWYWGQEVAAALRLYPSIRIVEGFRYVQTCKHTPFHFVSDYYRQRAELKASGDFGQIIIKLGLNSLYGKCAQSIGGKVVGKTDDGTEIHARPTYQSFVWAGMITSGTRAAILDAIRLGDVVSIATDGVISRSPIPLNIGNDLGTWDYRKIEQFTSVQNGVYRYAKPDGEGWYVRARGFSGREFNFDALMIAFKRQRERAKCETVVKRFVGLGSALQRAPTLTDWRVWITQARTIKLHPENRTLTVQWGLTDDRHMVTTRAWHGVQGVSSPYKPKTVFRHLRDGAVELLADPAG